MEPKYGICMQGRMDQTLYCTRELVADERLHMLEMMSVDPDDIEVVAVIDPQRVEELLDALGIAIDETEQWVENLFSDEEEKTAKKRLKWLNELEVYFQQHI